jgi:D-alanyl-D-alanine carboxypeptidase
MRSKIGVGIFAVAFVLSILLGTFKVSAANPIITFSDLTEEWQKEVVYSAVDKGIVKGYEDGTFKPNKKVTEVEFALMLVRSINNNELSMKNPWGDAHEVQSIYDEISKYGLPLLGYNNTGLQNSPIRRGQAAKIIARIYGFDLNVVEAVDFMYENGLSKGNGNIKDLNNYGAFDFLNRFQATAFVNAIYTIKQVTFQGIHSDVSGGRAATGVLYISKALPVNSDLSSMGRYALFQGKIYISSLEDITLAEQYGRQYTNAYLIDQIDKKLVWANFDRELDFTASTSRGNLFLINPNYPVTEYYQAGKMLNTADFTSEYLRVSDKDMRIDEVVFNPLQSMLFDVYATGADKLVLISAYRSYQTQNMLFQSRVHRLMSSMGQEQAEKQVTTSTAIPGSSEHQTGLAIDFVSKTVSVNQSFLDSAEGQWLSNNSWKYGFVVRYVGDKMEITGIINEPWHLRYVGVPHAEIMYKSGLCLEEYMNYVSNENMVQFSDHQGYINKIYYFSSTKSADLFNFLYLSDKIQSISGDGKGGIIVTSK